MSITKMFDFQASTEIAERLTPEDAEILLKSGISPLQHAIDHHRDSHVTTLLGDGVYSTMFCTLPVEKYDTLRTSAAPIFNRRREGSELV